MSKLHSKIKKIITLTFAAVMALSLCTGCGNERKEDQKALRLEGITLLENGKYEDALEKFQGALATTSSSQH